MTLNGPTEEDPNYIADTGFSPAEMSDQVEAYQETMRLFNQAVASNGGFTVRPSTARVCSMLFAPRKRRSPARQLKLTYATPKPRNPALPVDDDVVEWRAGEYRYQQRNRPRDVQVCSCGVVCSGPSPLAAI